MPLKWISPEQKPVVDRAIENLVAHLQAQPADVAVESIQAVEWRDASLGLPKPGEMYAQVLTPGYRVTLSHEGRLYTYHTDQKDRVLLATK
ncbi:MAG: hypothetical protein HY326_04920 [Chloroflexi bacterium]|nr:hypothetical protein [Chloroflexota bacterium]